MAEQGKFEAKIYIGMKNGKRITKHIRATTQRELTRKVAEARKDIQDNKDVFDKALFGVWAEKWMEEQILPNVGSGTVMEYRAAIKLLNARFEYESMKTIRLSDFQAFINELSREQTESGKFRSKKSLSDVKSVASRVFRYAMQNDVPGITDFFAGVRIPKNATQEERRALTEEEQRWILETPHRAQAAAMIMMFAGLRRGELIALQWSDIDFTANVIRVSRSVEFETNTATVKQGGKTKHAVRLVPIPHVLRNFLLRYREESPVLSLTVCPNAKGTMHTKSSWRKMWDSYLTELNVKYGYEGQNISKFAPTQLPMKIEPFTAHYLRHTYATILYLQGVNLETAKNFLGHANISITSDIYTHFDATLNINLLSPEYRKKLQTEYRVIPA